MERSGKDVVFLLAVKAVSVKYGDVLTGAIETTRLAFS